MKECEACGALTEFRFGCEQCARLVCSECLGGDLCLECSAAEQEEEMPDA